MKNELLPDAFIDESKNGVIIDVRTPAEFEQGHIPSAYNLPLFTNEERVVVGTLYVQQGKEVAVEKGLEFVGSKLAQLVKDAKKISNGKTIYLHCWRGGMRSNSVAWLLRTAGLQVKLLTGGYKAYRQSFIDLLEQLFDMYIVGGPTGCGKTDILHALQDLGEQVLDIEALANHKGSAFGGLGQAAQPTTEQFINDLHHAFRGFDLNKPIWCEGEGITTGKCYLPAQLFARMRSSKFIYFTIPEACRIERIKEEYGKFSTDELIDSFKRIERRMGPEKVKAAVELLNQGNIEEAIKIAMVYYDKGYNKSYEKSWKLTHSYQAPNDDPTATATELRNIIQQSSNL